MPHGTHMGGGVLLFRSISLDIVGCRIFGVPYSAEAGLELLIPLTQPSKYGDYRHVPQCLVLFFFLYIYLLCIVRKRLRSETISLFSACGFQDSNSEL